VNSAIAGLTSGVVSGGGRTRPGLLVTVATATVVACAWFGMFVANAAAEVGIQSFTTTTSTPEAGAHPDVTYFIKSNTTEPGGLFPDHEPKAIRINTPPGLLGTPSAAAYCPNTFATLEGREAMLNCPYQSQVGTFEVWIGGTPIGEEPQYSGGVFNMKPAPNEPGRLLLAAMIVPLSYIRVDSHTESDFGLIGISPEVDANAAVRDVRVKLWGVPVAHTRAGFFGFGILGNKEVIKAPIAPDQPGEVRKPFMTNPTVCDAPKTTRLEMEFFEHEQIYEASSAVPTPTNCQNLGFAPTIETQPTSSKPDDATGLDVKLEVPQNEDPNGVATSQLRRAEVTLPEGMSLNPSAADGLEACTDAQFGYGTKAAATCPEGSKIGTIAATIPQLPGPLQGTLYVGTQQSNDPQSGKMFRIFQYFEGYGLKIKLPGYVKADPGTGRLTAIFGDPHTMYGENVPPGVLDGLPQVPFSKAVLSFKGGSHGILTTPLEGGTKTTTSTMVPWSGGASTTPSSSFAVSGGAPAFEPTITAGATNATAGVSSPLTLTLSRKRGTQQFKGVKAILPPGLAAKIAGVPQCAPAAADAGTCAAATQVGTTTISTGAGESPLWIPRPGGEPTAVYLAGPYAGAPLSLSVLVPAKVGPFDFGKVVTRVALFIDPADAHVTAELKQSRLYEPDGSLSQVIDGALPGVVKGIPLDVQTINVLIDRPGFSQNPTNCSPMAVKADLTSLQGGSKSISSGFQVGGCSALDFKPKLAIDLKGGTKRNSYPSLSATLTQPEGQSNISRVAVTLPHSEFLAQNHIRTVCTRLQFAAKECPEGSIYGHATAYSPLLDQPLEGPVYLRSSSNKLPDMVAALHGQVDVELDGRIDSVKGGIRSTFDVVPDAPVSKFTLTMEGGKKGLLVNSRNICGSPAYASVQMDGQNGKSADQFPKVTNDCGKAKPHKKRSSKH